MLDEAHYVIEDELILKYNLDPSMARDMAKDILGSLKANSIIEEEK